jgi:hypothetical protein
VYQHLLCRLKAKLKIIQPPSAEQFFFANKPCRSLAVKENVSRSEAIGA